MALGPRRALTVLSAGLRNDLSRRRGSLALEEARTVAFELSGSALDLGVATL